MSRFVLTPAVRSGTPPKGLFTAEEYAAVDRFYANERPTMLHSLSHRASALRLEQLMVKDESSRMGLSAFKILGVQYAVARLRMEGRILPETVLACATDGNHGLAVARTARQLNLQAHIFLPRHASEKRIERIRAEGAHVHICGGSYDDAVRQAASEGAAHGWLVVSDTAWPGYEEIPRSIMCGYTQIFAEASRQWIAPPDVVFVQAGVGGLACAAGSWFAHNFGQWRPFLILCQAANAACVVEAARRGGPTALTGSLETVMDCLSAGEVSHTAWPVLSSIYDAYMTVRDDEALDAVRRLHEDDVESGCSGACGMAALWSVLHDPALAVLKEAAGIDGNTRAMLIVTEGP